VVEVISKFQNLDEDQINAVKYLDNTLVIAGAGSGKSTTIIAKIEYLLENHYYQPHEILVISFTNESVNDLKKKINHPLAIKTFHKLALEIIDDKNIKICHDNYLNYIIKEYFNSFAITNHKTRIRLKRILMNNHLDNLRQLACTFINLYKANYQGISHLFHLYKTAWFIEKDYLYIMLEIYQMYYRELESSGLLDFNDMIAQATNLINHNKQRTPYKLIIIDEFQDTSLIRFKLIESILKQNDGKIFAVGDDCQSIYRFSGCDLAIFLNLKKYLPDVKMLFLNHNYRNHHSLVNIANQFILKNTLQIKKNTVCHKNIDKPIVIHYYDNPGTILEQIIPNISGHILVLGRNNRDKDTFHVIENDNLRFLTIHRAKGLEEETVILINLTNQILGFPSQIKNEQLLSKVTKNDYLLYEEERRLFYVALTRTKNKVFLLVPRERPSVFVKELIKEYRSFIDFQ